MLDDLFQQAIQASKRREALRSVTDLEVLVSELPAAKNVYQHLAKSQHLKLIAEIKRASPSRGFLADISDAGELASIYESAGAHAISVLTEESGFAGSLDDLVAARARVEIPLLRKDFISNQYQILEARVAGADFVLLILAWLTEQRFRELYAFATELGLGVLVETHSLDEIAIANHHGSKLIGINTRNLENFKTDIGLFERMSSALDPESIRVAESSVKNLDDVIRYRSAGADVVLVGEALVTGEPKLLIPAFTSV